LKFKNLEQASAANFRRATGVKRTTFEKMIEILTKEHEKKKARGGRPNKLGIPDMLLMTLEYLREYRTYLSIAMTYGLSESNAYATIRWVEDILVQSKEFRLPGKKALLASDHEFEIVLIDATETPIERPKKNNVNITQGKRSAIL
jgi:hypothetical protein